jgi:hypothetical protein
VPPFDVAPIIPVLRSHPFNDPEWLFEPKYDGFRGLVYIAAGACLIRSKKGTTFKRFASLCEELPRELNLTNRRSPMRMRSVWLAPAGLVGTLAAQTPPLPELEPGVRIRLETSAVVGRLSGHFDQYRADSLIMRSPTNARTALPVRDLAKLWVRGHATKTGAIVGAAIGVAAGAFIGGAGCGLAHSDDGIIGNEDFDFGCAAAGAGIGLIIGGGMGAGVGALIPKWHLRYPVAH